MSDTPGLDQIQGALRPVTAGYLFVLLGFLVPAQAAGPNPGALTFSGAFDVPSVYLFRGLRQEVDPAATMWPHAYLKIDLMSGDGGLKSTAINFGVWTACTPARQAPAGAASCATRRTSMRR